jgi:hypothetical protein
MDMNASTELLEISINYWTQISVWFWYSWLGKGKVKKANFSLEQAMKVHRGSRGIALHFLLTWALGVGGWSKSRLGRFTPGKEIIYPFYRRLRGPQDGSGRVQKISPPELDPRTVQSLARSEGRNRIGVCWIYPSLNRDNWRAVLKNVTIFRIL